MFFGGYVDLDGRQVERTPREYPYSYDMFVLHQKGHRSEITASAYSDRLSQWDYAFNEELKVKYFGRESDYYARENSMEKLQEFLRERLNLPKLMLIAVMEGCNAGNGYPYWWFGYKTGE